MPRKTADLIKEHLRNGRFRYSIHCDKTADDRIITADDIRNVGRTVRSMRLQDNGAYKVVGLDEASDDLTVICRLSAKTNLLIITVY